MLATGPQIASASKIQMIGNQSLQEFPYGGVYPINSNVYIGQPSDPHHVMLNRNIRTSAGHPAVNQRLQGGKSSSVHSQKHISVNKID